jgi:MFS transporter, DHA1 family, inner membrane transport protein
MNKKERILLLLLAGINFTHILDFMIMMPLGNYLMPYFHISPREFSMLVSSYSLSAFGSSILSAFFVNEFDRKKVLLVGYVGFLIGTIACGYAPGFHLLLAARILAGLFGGIIGAQVISIVSDTFSYERRGRAMGSIMSAFAAASIVGVPFALYLSNHFSWHAPFRLVGILGIILIPLIVYVIPPMTLHLKNAQHRSKLESFTTVVGDKKQLSALLFSGLVMFGHFLIIPFINPYMEFNNGYSKDLTPLIYLFGGIASLVAASILGRLSDKKGKLLTYIICVLLALPMVYGVTNIPRVPYFWVLLLFAAWFVVSTGRGITSQAMISNVVKPEFRGSFQSFNSGMQQLGTGLASVVTGFIVSKDPSGKILHYDWAGYLSIAVLFSTVFIAQRVFKSFETINPPVINLPAKSTLQEVTVDNE